jgi:pimeloyl-ACP methyl ester carboxylesterase
MNLIVPAASQIFDVDLEDGAKIRMRRHGNRDGVRLLVTHGNGFAADAYLPFWQHLTSRYDVLVYDFRNHGQNIPVSPPNHNYAQMSRGIR